MGLHYTLSGATINPSQPTTGNKMPTLSKQKLSDYQDEYLSKKSMETGESRASIVRFAIQAMANRDQEIIFNDLSSADVEES